MTAETSENAGDRKRRRHPDNVWKMSHAAGENAGDKKMPSWVS
jgi:hypothetical protein